MKPVFKTEEVIEHFGGRKNGGVKKLAEALGCTTNAIYQWGELTPEASGYEILVKTKGSLSQVERQSAA